MHFLQSGAAEKVINVIKPHFGSLSQRNDTISRPCVHSHDFSLFRKKGEYLQL